MCDKHSLRSACAYAQSDQSLCLSLEYFMTVKLLTEHHLEFLSLKRGSTGSSESILVKMPHCWKSHLIVHIVDFVTYHMSEQRRLRPIMRSHVSSTMVDSCSYTVNNVRSPIICFQWLIRTPTCASRKVLA